MKFVALVSGGKDSCYNIMKCIQNGHQLVCIANLCPPREFQGEDMDSFMYQTAGYSVMTAYADCLGCSLIRREIKGVSVSQHLNYDVTENDEVEDLFLLLGDVLTQFPDVTAVSCGAILSNYQRFRVENVCNRLGLIPLQYLWQRDRESLLSEMLFNGVHAILVKVSGGGLDPLKHVGKDLAALQPVFQRLKERYGLDICGEGGEYESLVLDCPIFKKRIELLETEILIDKDDPSVGYLSISKYAVHEKPLLEDDFIGRYGLSRCPELRSVYQRKLADGHSIKESTADSTDSEIMTTPTITVDSLMADFIRTSHGLCGVDGFGSSDMIYPMPSSASTREELGMVCKSQLNEIFRKLLCLMNSVGGALCDICYVHLYVSDMTLFGDINEEYTQWFGSSPPSRSCVMIHLPTGVHTAVDVLYLVGSHVPIGLGRSSRREVLHVQSVSEWAPMSIGPYSQGNLLGSSIALIAGQIGLRPEIMSIVHIPTDISLRSKIVNLLSEFQFPRSTRHRRNRFCAVETDRKVKLLHDINIRELVEEIPLEVILELILSLHNANEVLCSLNSDTRTRTASCVVYLDIVKITSFCRERLSGRCFHADIRNLAQWLIANGIHHIWNQVDRLVSGTSDVDTDAGHCDEDDEGILDSSEDEVVSLNIPIVVIGVKGLPRGALVEVEVIGVSENFSKCPVMFKEDFTNSLSHTIELEGTVVSAGIPPCFPLLQAAQGDAKVSLYQKWLKEDPSKQVDHSFSTTSLQLCAPTLVSEPIQLQRQFCAGPNCFCTGIISVDCDYLTTSAACVTELIVVDIIVSILRSINRVVTDTELTFDKLKYVKFFLSFQMPCILPEFKSCVESKVRNSFRSALSLPLMFIWSDDETSSFKNNIHACFMAVDLLQMKTEMWLRGD